MARRFMCFWVVILFVGVSCEEEPSNSECGAYGSYFRFTVEDKTDGSNLFFGDGSLYSEDDLKLYVVTRKRSENPADTISYLPLNTLERDSGRIFASFLPANPNGEQQVFARIGKSDIDTLLVTSRSDGYYDDGSCERIVADNVYYNNELVCTGCNDSVSYIIKK